MIQFVKHTGLLDKVKTVAKIHRLNDEWKRFNGAYIMLDADIDAFRDQYNEPYYLSINDLEADDWYVLEEEVSLNNLFTQLEAIKSRLEALENKCK